MISGIRLGSPVAAVRRCGVDEVLTTYDTPAEAEVSQRAHAEVQVLCRRFPVYNVAYPGA